MRSRIHRAHRNKRHNPTRGWKGHDLNTSTTGPESNYAQRLDGDSRQSPKKGGQQFGCTSGAAFGPGALPEAARLPPLSRTQICMGTMSPCFPPAGWRDIATQRSTQIEHATSKNATTVGCLGQRPASCAEAPWTRRSALHAYTGCVCAFPRHSLYIGDAVVPCKHVTVVPCKHVTLSGGRR